MLNQKLQQKLLQKLSPQQILLMKLLQIPSMALEQRIKQEIEENPAIEEVSDVLDEDFPQEEGTDYDDDLPASDSGDDAEEDSYGSDEPETSRDDEFDIEDYLEDDDVASYRYQANNTSPDDEQRETPLANGITFHENLLQQLGLRVMEPRSYQIASHMIGNLDDAGYLNRDLTSLVDDLAFLQNIETTEKELATVLALIQDLDPPGVGARSLKECLLLQLKRKPLTEEIKHAIFILDRCFDEFTKKHYQKILKKARINEEQLKKAMDEILRLNPKPGNSVSETTKANFYIIPDFIIFNNDGELELVLNSRNMPELRVNRQYSEMLQTYSETRDKRNSHQREALMFVKQKIDSARWFIDALRQRQNTLLVTMRAIMEYQDDYFLTGDETRLKPMILKDIAERVGLDISTISRVANSKYVQTPFGTFLLKSFFSESLQNTDGEEVSTREVKKILQDCIESESKSKPLTDEELMEILKEKGYLIARRTVAKYREQLGIPVARLRKEL
jgi:RNA polymerase sigma-54 factor